MSNETNTQEEEVLIDVPVVEEETNEKLDTSELSPEELEMAVEQGLIEKDGEDKEDKEEKEVEEEESTTEPESFEQMEEVFEKDNKKFHKDFKSNEKALYFKYKKEKLRRQEYSKELEELKAEKELGSIKGKVSTDRLAKVREALNSGEELTVDSLRELIGDAEVKDDGRMTQEEHEAKVKQGQMTQQAYNDRVMLAEQIGISKYPNFDKISAVAEEVAKGDKDALQIIADAFTDKNIDEGTIVEKVVKVARMHPKFKEMTQLASPEEKEEVNRAIKNSKKAKSSASLGSSGKSMQKRESELSPSDVANTSTGEWRKLSEKTQERLLREVSS